MPPPNTEDEPSVVDAKGSREGLSRDQIFEHGNFEEIALNDEDNDTESSESKTSTAPIIPPKKNSAEAPPNPSPDTIEETTVESTNEEVHRPRKYKDRRIKPVKNPTLKSRLASTNLNGTPKSKTDPEELRKQFARLPNPTTKPAKKPIFSVSFLRKNLLTTLGLIVLGVIAGIIFVVYQGINSFYALVFQKSDPPPALVQPEVNASGFMLEDTFLTSDMESGALAAIRDYLEADGWEAKLRFVRNPDALRPLMERYYSASNHDGLDAPSEAGEVIMRNEMMDNDRLFIKLALPIAPDQNIKFFAVERTPDNEYKVDWEVSEGYQEMPYAKFVEERPVEPRRFRVLAKRGDYYNYQFDDPQKHLCLELRYPGNPNFLLYGYIDPDSNFGKKIAQAVPYGMEASIILTLAYPEDSNDEKQVEIWELIADTWFL
ncbi:MAG: hypothetical protein AAF591_00970 [Verrucomicrobiota bacterium]